MSDDADGSNVARQFKTRTGRRISAERVKRLARTGRLPIAGHEGPVRTFVVSRSRGRSPRCARADAPRRRMTAAAAELSSYSDAWDCEPSAVRFDPATRTRNREIRSRMCAIVDCISTQHSCSVVMCPSRSVTSSARWPSVCLTLTVGQLGTDTMVERSQFFDMPHRVVDRADLSLQVGEQIKLVRGECFGLFLERTHLDGSGRLVAHRRCWFAAISRYGLGCTAQSTCTNLHPCGEWSKTAALTLFLRSTSMRLARRHGRMVQRPGAIATRMISNFNPQRRATTLRAAARAHSF